MILGPVGPTSEPTILHNLKIAFLKLLLPFSAANELDFLCCELFQTTNYLLIYWLYGSPFAWHEAIDPPHHQTETMICNIDIQLVSMDGGREALAPQW